MNDADRACITEHNMHDKESDKDSTDDVLEDIVNNMKSTVSQGGNVELPKPEASVNEDFEENWLTRWLYCQARGQTSVILHNDIATFITCYLRLG